MKNKKAVVSLVCAFACCLALGAAGCTSANVGTSSGSDGSSGVSSSEAVREKPVITVGKETLNGIVGKPVTIPAATARDTEQGDISSAITMTVYFDRDMNYVYPLENPRDGVDGSVEHQFTPKKVGEYTVTYTVKNNQGMKTNKEITLTVAESGEENPAQLVSDKENWVLSETASFNAEEELEVGPGAAVAYGGKKLESGDYVEFSFNADAPEGTMFYWVGAQLSKNGDKDRPAENEAFWPTYLHLRISKRIEVFITSGITHGNNETDWIIGGIDSNLLDGGDHTVALRSTVSEQGGEKAVTFEIWVDGDVSSSPKFSATFTETQLKAEYGDNYEGKASRLFDKENFGGFFNVGSYKQGDADDCMRIKSLSINGEQAALTPTLKVKSAPSKSYLVNEEISFPEAEAEDQNNYSDLANRIGLTVTGPITNGGTATETPLDGYTFTPTEIGRYQLRYTVVDYSGNRKSVFYEFRVAKSASTELPTIVFAEETETLTAEVGKAFAIPAVESVTDADGEDLSDFLTIDLIGGEAKSLLGAAECTLRTAGTHIIRYSVTDYNGNVKTVDIPVTVTSPYVGSIDVDSDNFAVYGGAKLVGDGLDVSNGGCSAAFKGQKVYGEKVRMLVDFKIASAFGAGDGVDFFMLNIRAGKNLNKIPGDRDCGSFDWPSGLIIEINASEGIAIYCGGHGSNEMGKYLFPEGTRKAFEGEVEFSWQAADEYNENGVYTGTRLKIWLNGEQLMYSGQDDGSIYIPARRAQSIGALKAGWLSVYNYGTTSEFPCVIKAITIDGTTPAKKVVTIPEGEADKTISFGETYTFPEVTAVCGEKVYTLKKYIQINGEENRTEVTENTLVADELYTKGFKVFYVDKESGKTLATLNVSVNATPSDIVFDKETENLTVQLGENFEYPTITSFKFGETEITEGITIVKRYPGTKIAEETVSGTMLVSLYRDFILSYRYGSLILAEVSVTITGESEGDIDLGNYANKGGTQVHKAREIYGETVTIIFAGQVTGVSDIILRGKGNADWPALLRLRFGNAEIKVTSNGDGGDSILCDRNVWPKALNAEKNVLVYSAADRYDENGNFLGIYIEIFLNGSKIEWQSGIAQYSDGLIRPEKIKEMESDGKTPFVPSDIYLCIRDNQTIEKVVIGEYVPVEVTIPEGEENKTVDLGAVYTFPEVTAVQGERTLTLKKYILINGETERTEVTEAALTVTEAYKKGFKVLYVDEESGKVLATLNVTVNAQQKPDPTENLWKAENIVNHEGVDAYARYKDTIYDEKVTLKIHMKSDNYNIAIRGATEDSRIPSGLALTINSNHVIFTKDASNPYGAGNIFWFRDTKDLIPQYESGQDVTITYQCTDIKDADGKVVTIHVVITVEGQEFVWDVEVGDNEAYTQRSKIMVGHFHGACTVNYNVADEIKELYIEG